MKCKMMHRINIKISSIALTPLKSSGHYMYHQFNTLSWGHAEMRDCYPMRCCRIRHFYVYIRLSAGLAHLSLQGYGQLGAGCLGLKLQTNRPVLTPYF